MQVTLPSFCSQNQQTGSMPKFSAIKSCICRLLFSFSAVHALSQQAYSKNMFPDEPLYGAALITQDMSGNKWITAVGQLIKYDSYNHYLLPDEKFRFIFPGRPERKVKVQSL